MLIKYNLLRIVHKADFLKKLLFFLFRIGFVNFIFHFKVLEKRFSHHSYFKCVEYNYVVNH